MKSPAKGRQFNPGALCILLTIVLQMANSASLMKWISGDSSARVLVLEHEMREWEISKGKYDGSSEIELQKFQELTLNSSTDSQREEIKEETSKVTDTNLSSGDNSKVNSLNSSTSSSQRLSSSTTRDEPFRPLYSFEASEIELISEAANKIIGEGKLEQHHKLNVFMHASETLIKGCIVIIYRPILTGLDLNGDLLRLAYHSLAQQKYQDLVSFLGKVKELESRDIIMAGAVDAGLIANYHAAMLIRKHSIVGKLGNYQNSLQQVKVVTFNSSAPYTPGAVQYYQMNKNNFIDFHTGIADSMDYARWGHVFTLKETAMLQSITAGLDDSYHKGYFNEQNLGSINQSNLLSTFVNHQTPHNLATKLAEQHNRAQSATLAAAADYEKVQERLKNEELYMCTEQLRQKIQDAIASKYKSAQIFAGKYRLANNWSLKDEITCLPIDINKVLAKGKRKSIQHQQQQQVVEGSSSQNSFYVTCHFGQKHEFATFRLEVIEKNQFGLATFNQDQSFRALTFNSPSFSKQSDDHHPLPLPQQQQDDNDNMISPGSSPKNANSFSSSLGKSPPKFLESKLSLARQELNSSLKSSSLDECLKALFEEQPYLQMFSPFHPLANNFHLSYDSWPHGQRKCQASLTPNDLLKQLYKTNRAGYISLMTSPNMINPIVCQSGTLPLPYNAEKDDSIDYWTNFYNFLQTHRSSTDFEIQQLVSHSSPSGSKPQSKIQKLLFETIYADFDRTVIQNQYDCSDPVTLWHSNDFCPKMCRIITDSNFCKRVYIAPSGLKLSLRGDSKLYFGDKSARDWAETFNLTTKYENHACFFLKLWDKVRRRTFYLAMYLEGGIYQKFSEQWERIENSNTPALVH